MWGQIWVECLESSKVTNVFFLEFWLSREGFLSNVVFFLINDFLKMRFSLFIWDGVHIHRIKWRRWNVLWLFYWRPHMLVMFFPFIVIILCVCLYVLLDHINPNNFMACKIFRKNQNFSSNHIKIWSAFYLKSHKL